MTRQSKTKWARMVEGVRSYVDDQDRAWGGVDANLLARFESGSCTEEERARVEQAMRDYPAVREAVEIGREITTGEEESSGSEAKGGNKTDKKRLWTDLTHPTEDKHNNHR